MIDNPNLIGYTAAALTSISAIPQLIKIYRMKSARTLSWIFSIIIIASTSLWIIYEILLSEPPIIICNVLLLSVWIGIVALKIKYDVLTNKQLNTQ